jgi:membrane associated rhomboid family serine protease
MFVLPINEDGYVGRTPYVIAALVLINGLALAAIYTLSSSQAVFAHYGFTPAQPHTLTVLSSMFLHAGILHYAGNMFFLWMFGYRIENTFGIWLFTFVYLLCGVGATGLHYLFNANSTIPSVGASGAISGIMGCYFVLFPKSKFDLEVFFLRFHVTSIPTHTHGAIGVWVAEQALLGLLTQTVRFSSTAFWAHVGGFATGGALTLVLLLLIPEIRERGEQPFMVRHVKGAIHDAYGDALPNARIELHCPSGEVLSATAGPNGRFEFDKLADGSYHCIVTREGWEPVHGRIMVRKKTRYSVPIKIRMAEQVIESALSTKSQTAVPNA